MRTNRVTLVSIFLAVGGVGLLALPTSSSAAPRPHPHHASPAATAGRATASVATALLTDSLVRPVGVDRSVRVESVALASLHLPPAAVAPVHRTAPAVAVPAPSAAPAAPRPTVATPAVATGLAGDFARLRSCESGDDYAEDTGNGFYGAYQFSAQTWHGMGYAGLPTDYPPAFQDAAAERLEAARGWEPWPACSARLGL